MGLYKRPGSAVWWCRFQIAGHEIKRSTRTTDRRAAQVEERRLRAQVEATAPARRSRRTVGLAELAGYDVARAVADNCTAGYQHNLVYTWEKITDHFGTEREPATIDYQAVQAYVLKRRADGVVGHTIKREVTALRRGLLEAHERGYLPFMPARWPRTKLDPPGTSRRGKLHPPVILAQWLAALPSEARDLAEVALFTSLRSTEIQRMTADWIEPAPEGFNVEAVLRIPAAAAKTRRERIIPLAPRVLAILARRAAATEPGLPLLPRTHKSSFEWARLKIGYSRHISLRDLRHTWATLANRSVGIDAAKAGLGHTTLAMTDRYVTVDIERTAKAALAIEGLIGTAETAQASKAAERTQETMRELTTS